MRPLLAPGAHVLRRHDGSFQVGLDPRDAVVLPGTQAVAGCLQRLDGSPVRGADRGTVALLYAAGLVVDERAVIPLLAAARSPALAAHMAATIRAHRGRAGEAVVRRARRPVGLHRFGHPDGAGLVERLAALLGDGGLPSVLPVDAGPPGDRPDCAVTALVGLGEPDRELVDGWMRERVPHLLVRFAEGRATVGPFVVPGETACLRCVDAHHADADPTWPLLVRQYAAAVRVPRGDGTPEPLDPLLAAVALAWAARDLATYADGGRPSTWSTTLTLDPAHGGAETRAWSRHPGCGCSWQ